MDKFYKNPERVPTEFDYYFHCEGCHCDHGIWTDAELHRSVQPNCPIWTFNGDLEKPTIRPSILVSYKYGEDNVRVCCHSFITEGNIQYLDDCTHHLVGKTIPLVTYLNT